MTSGKVSLYFKGLVVALLLGVSYVLYSGWKSSQEFSANLDPAYAQIAAAFRPGYKVQTRVLTSLGEIQKTSKLVVMTAFIDVSVRKESEKKVLWDLLDLGTTTVYADFPDNKVQFILPLKDVKPENFSFQGNILTLRLPAPKVDEEVVEVQSDPSKIEVRTDVGWARLKSQSGKQLEEQALMEIRNDVLMQARAEPLLEDARDSAKAELLGLLSPVVDLLKPGVKLDIEFI